MASGRDSVTLCSAHLVHPATLEMGDIMPRTNLLLTTLSVLVFALSSLFATPCGAQTAPPTETPSSPEVAPSEAVSPPEYVEAEPDKGSATETLAAVTLGAWSLGTFVASPLTLVALADDIDLGEAALLSLTNLLGVGVLGAGFGVMGAGAALMLIGTIGVIISFGTWGDAAGAIAAGLTMVGVGALMTFVLAPLVFTLNTTVVDGELGEKPGSLLVPTVSLILGSAAGGVGGYYIADLLVDYDDHPVLSILSIVGTSLLLGNLSYVLVREVFDDNDPKDVVMVATPVLAF